MIIFLYLKPNIKQNTIIIKKTLSSIKKIHYLFIKLFTIILSFISIIEII